MNTLPPLPPELGRFDSIVDAHKAGNLDRYIEALTENEKTINSIIEESCKVRLKYYTQQDALNNALAEAIHLKYKLEQQYEWGQNAN